MFFVVEFDMWNTKIVYRSPSMETAKNWAVREAERGKTIYTTWSVHFDGPTCPKMYEIVYDAKRRAADVYKPDSSWA